VAVVTSVGAMWLAAIGAFQVVRISSATNTTVPFWYMLMAFPILGMLVADVFTLKVSNKLNVFWVELVFQIVILVFISGLRLIFRLPISGHALLFSYFILRRIIIRIPDHKTRNLEFIVAIVFLVIMAYVKLVLWNDCVTPFSGLGIAILMMLFSYLVISPRWKAEK
jgi:hypothetical protein